MIKTEDRLSKDRNVVYFLKIGLSKEKEQAVEKLCETLLLRTKEGRLEWYALGHSDYLVVRYERAFFPILFRLSLSSVSGWILTRYLYNQLPIVLGHSMNATMDEITKYFKEVPFIDDMKDDSSKIVELRRDIESSITTQPVPGW